MEAQPATTNDAPEAASPPPVSPPARELALKRGMRIRLGEKPGRVDCVRGGWVKPYEVRVHWDGEPQPQYIIFTSLQRDFREGRLQIVRD